MDITRHFAAAPRRRTSLSARLHRRPLPVLAPERLGYASLEIVRSKPYLSAKEAAAGLRLLARGFSGADALAAVLAGRAFLAAFPVAGGGR